MKTIASEQELDAIIASSSERPVLIFKHSNACPISARAHSEMQRLVDDGPDAGVELAMIVVQTARPLAVAVEARFGIRHESPQAILVRDGEAVWNASHFDVTRDRVASALEAS